MAHQRFHTLEVYQLAEQVSDTLWTIVEEWDDFAKETIGRELVRSADQLGAIIAAATITPPLPGQTARARSARMAFNELQHWLRRARKRELFTSEQMDQIKQAIQDLTPLFNRHLRLLESSSTGVEQRTWEDRND